MENNCLNFEKLVCKIWEYYWNQNVQKQKEFFFIRYDFLNFEMEEDAEEARERTFICWIMNKRVRVEPTRRELWSEEEMVNQKNRVFDKGWRDIKKSTSLRTTTYNKCFE